MQEGVIFRKSDQDSLPRITVFCIDKVTFVANVSLLPLSMDNMKRAGVLV